MQIDFDNQEIAHIDKEIAWLREKQGRIARAQAERQAARDKIAVEVEHCVARARALHCLLLTVQVREYSYSR